MARKRPSIYDRQVDTVGMDPEMAATISEDSTRRKKIAFLTQPFQPDSIRARAKELGPKKSLFEQIFRRAPAKRRIKPV